MVKSAHPMADTSLDQTNLGEILTELGLSFDPSQIKGGVTIESAEQNGNVGVLIRDESGNVNGFIPDSSYDLIAAGTAAPNQPFWNQKKCYALGLSLLTIEASTQAMTLKDSSQSVESKTITDIKDGKLVTSGGYNVGKFAPSVAIIATGLLFYHLCRPKPPPPPPPLEPREVPVGAEPALEPVERSLFEDALDAIGKDLQYKWNKVYSFTSAHGEAIISGVAVVVIGGAIVYRAVRFGQTDPSNFQALSLELTNAGNALSRYWRW